jgi:membrane associated rhomboid family serine protease
MPATVLACIVLLLALHGIRTFFLSSAGEIRLLLEVALVPARWTLALNPARAPELLREAAEGSGPMAVALARYIVAEAEPKWWSALTYGALHGSWTHAGLNAVWLAAFGTPVARRCGTLRFVLLFAIAVVCGGLAHAVIHPMSVEPLIGASAGVSGLMAAAARFVFMGDEGRGLPLGARSYAPAQSLPELLANRRAALFLAVWFGTNFLFGALAAPLGVVDSSIAWEAHIGGFLAGLLLFPWFDPYGDRRRTP